MNKLQRKDESRFLEQVSNYRKEYRKLRTAKLNEERALRYASDEVYLAGCWVPGKKADQVAAYLQRREFWTLIEILVLLVVLLALAFGLWRLFSFLLLP